jgi:hypothetical protein
MIPPIQDFDWALGERQVSLERCNIRQYHIHECLQALLQLRHMEYVMNPSQ